jgi:hypothetical protein
LKEERRRRIKNNFDNGIYIAKKRHAFDNKDGVGVTECQKKK